MKRFNTNPLYCVTLLLCSLLIVSAGGYDDYDTAVPKTYYSSSKVREYTFYINRTVLAPDGFFRRVSTVNGQFPGPAIHAVVGDKVKVKVINGLDEPTTIHWHGISQKGTPWYDGVLGMTQCGIPSGESLTYEFVVSDPGTYWWHSHYKAQYVDGILGSLIVYDPHDPYSKDYDEEYTVLISWWYHDESSVLLKSLFSPGDGPEPNGGLINGRFNYNCSLAPAGSKCKSDAPLSKFKFEKGKKYRLRVINTSADGVMNFSIDKHILKVIEVDGFNVEPYTTHRIATSPGQRYSVIVEANQAVDNYYMRADLDEVDDGVKLNPNVTAIIHYEGASEDKAPTDAPWDYSEILEDDLLIKPLHAVAAPSPAGKQFTLHVNMTDDDAGLSHGVVNNSSYIPDFTYATLQKVRDNQNVSTANQNAITFDKYGEIIDFVIQNDDTEKHPFHMHGHKFWLLGAGNGTYIPGKSPLNIKAPIQRDTSRVPGGGYSVFRIVADNPGVWGFHCHIEWHLELGMSAQLVELPSAIKRLNEPSEVASLCSKK